MKETYTFTKHRDLKRSPRSALTVFIVCVVAIITGYKYLGRYSQDLVSISSASRWEPYASNPVLPDKEHEDFLGTVFDVSVLYDNGMWKMYGSWRRNGSISFSTSFDGFVWDQNLQFALGGLWDSKWETIVNRPFVLKRATEDYLLWYTGQIDGKKMGGKLGFAKSWNGNEFFREVGRPLSNAHRS